MRSPAELPGFRGLASEVLTALGEGSLVSVSVPLGSIGRRWLAWLMEAIHHRTRERGEPVATVTPALLGSLTEPLAELAALDSLGRVRNLDDLLEYHPDEGTLVLMIECEHTLGQQWKTLLETIRRAYLGVGSQRRLRPVLAIITGSHEYPPIAHDVGTRVFALWNTVRWEELRLLADAVLPRGENALTRAWRVATYAGAANGDPEILVRLCRESPGPLDQVVALALDGTDARTEVGQWVRTTLDQRWEVPPAAVEPWTTGEVFGETIERGPVRTTGGMAAKTANRYLLAAIWREQLTGLLPVVVELGVQRYGSDHRDHGNGLASGSSARARGFRWRSPARSEGSHGHLLYRTVRPSTTVDLEPPRFAPANSQRSCAHVSRRAAANEADLAGARPHPQTVRRCWSPLPVKLHAK